MKHLRNIFRNINRKKSMHLDCTKSEMKRCLGTWTLSALSIGNILGCGLYIVTAEVTHIAGPSAVISYIIAGISALIISLCYSEFAVRFPKAGSVYYYSYVAFGELCAFFAGWNASFEKLVSSAAIAKAQSNFINYMTNSAIENLTIEYILNGKVWDYPVVADYPDFLASFIVIIVCLILAVGTQLSSRVSSTLVLINAFVIATIFGTCIYYADFSRWTDNGGFFPFGAKGVVFGVTACFWVYTGFDDITSYSEEIINPSKSIPVATFVGIGTTIVTNVVIILMITLVQPHQEIDENSLLTSVFASHGNIWMSIVIAIGVMTTVASIIVTHSALARIFQNMAADGLVFRSLSHINKRTAVPVKSTIFLGLICAVMAMFFDVIKLVEFSVLGALSTYIVTSIGVIIFRYRDPDVDKVEQPTTSYDNNNEHKLLFDKRKSKLQATTPKQKYKIYQPKRYATILVENYCIESVVTWCVFLIITFLTVISIVVIHFNYQLWNEPNRFVILLVVLMSLATALVFSILVSFEELNIPKGYKVPMTPYFPTVAVVITIVFILFLKPVTWLGFLCWNIIGLLLYIFYGYRNSIEGLLKSRFEQTPLLNNNISGVRQDQDSCTGTYSSYESTI